MPLAIINIFFNDLQSELLWRWAENTFITNKVKCNQKEQRNFFRAEKAENIRKRERNCPQSGDVFNQEGGKVYAPASDFIPVDAEIPGCPPRPSEILEAILAVGPQAIANRGREKKWYYLLVRFTHI